MAKILFAEDDEITQRIVATTIEKMGHVVYISPNGRHAYETLMVNKGFKLVITDVMMPEMDGRELTKAIRTSVKYPEIPIIIISAFVGPKDISGLLKTGATIFQPKPLVPKELEENIDRYIAK